MYRDEKFIYGEYRDMKNILILRLMLYIPSTDKSIIFTCHVYRLRNSIYAMYRDEKCIYGEYRDLKQISISKSIYTCHS